MTDQHRATPKHWELIELAFGEGKNVGAYCLLELRARVEVLEKAQRKAAMDELHAASANCRPATTDSLVERVADVLTITPRSSDKQARAAIREVAEWLIEHYTPDTTDRPAGQMLLDEANR